MKKRLAAAAALGAVAAHDLVQRRHAILRNFPVIGHARFWLEAIGPELRQYIVAGNDEERPFSRDQRRWVYASAKLQNNYFGFGTDNDIEHSDRVPHHQSPHLRAGHPAVTPPSARRSRSVGEGSGRSPRPAGSIPAGRRWSTSRHELRLSLRQRHRCHQPRRRPAGCLHNTGEGGISNYHRNGGDLIFQIGTAYFGCRDEDGRFDLPRLKDLVPGPRSRPWRSRSVRAPSPALAASCPAAKVSPRDRRHPRRPHRARLHQPIPPRRVRRRRLHARLRGAARRRDGSARRASSQRSATSTFWHELAT